MESFPTTTLGSGLELASLLNQNIYGTVTNQLIYFSGIYKKIVVVSGIYKKIVAGKIFLIDHISMFSISQRCII